MNPNDPITIWGVGTTRTMRVHWMLHELGLDYETRRIESRSGETTEPEFTNLNPRQKIPFMLHGEMIHGEIAQGALVLAESYAIIHYLRSISENLPYDDFQLSTRGRAKYDEWLSFFLMELDATSLYVVRRHKDLPNIYGEAPAAVNSSIEYFIRMLDAVADQISPDGPLWGESFSELDILLTITLDWADFLAIPLPDHLRDYQQLMHSRPAYQRSRTHNFRDLKVT